MAKKKMTKAQAASARRDQTADQQQHAKAREYNQVVRKSAQNAQKKASQSAGARMVVPIVVVLVIVVMSLVFTIGPGMVVGS